MYWLGMHAKQLEKLHMDKCHIRTLLACQDRSPCVFEAGMRDKRQLACCLIRAENNWMKRLTALIHAYSGG